jgi:hypothetical protein
MDREIEMMTTRIEYTKPPEDWTRTLATDQLAYFRKIPKYQRSSTRPFNMQDITLEATVAAWEILGFLASGKTNKRRKGQLARVASDLGVKWRQLVVLPVLLRSDEHKIALVQAAWAVKLLRDMLDAWGEK